MRCASDTGVTRMELGSVEINDIEPSSTTN